MTTTLVIIFLLLLIFPQGNDLKSSTSIALVGALTALILLVEASSQICQYLYCLHSLLLRCGRCGRESKLISDIVWRYLLYQGANLSDELLAFSLTWMDCRFCVGVCCCVCNNTIIHSKIMTFNQL